MDRAAELHRQALELYAHPAAYSVFARLNQTIKADCFLSTSASHSYLRRHSFFPLAVWLAARRFPPAEKTSRQPIPCARQTMRSHAREPRENLPSYLKDCGLGSNYLAETACIEETSLAQLECVSLRQNLPYTEPPRRATQPAVEIVPRLLKTSRPLLSTPHAEPSAC